MQEYGPVIAVFWRGGYQGSGSKRTDGWTGQCVNAHYPGVERGGGCRLVERASSVDRCMYSLWKDRRADYLSAVEAVECATDVTRSIRVECRKDGQVSCRSRSLDAAPLAPLPGFLGSSWMDWRWERDSMDG